MIAAKHLCLLALLLVPAVPADSQLADCGKPVVPITARDKQGKLVPLLKASDFRAKLGGKQARVVSAKVASGAPRVVILIDKSGSMQGDVKSRVVQFVASSLVRSSPPDTKFALVVFGSRILETEEFGHSREDILSAIGKATSSPNEGLTALRDALLHASTLFGPAQAGDSIIVLSDGIDDRSKTSYGTLQQAYWSEGARVFLFEFSDSYMGTPEEEGSRQDFEGLSLTSGGGVWKIERPDNAVILSATHEIEEDLSTFHLLQLEFPQSLQKPVSLDLELLDSSDRKRRDVKLSFPRKLMPCGPVENQH